MKRISKLIIILILFNNLNAFNQIPLTDNIIHNELIDKGTVLSTPDSPLADELALLVPEVSYTENLNLLPTEISTSSWTFMPSILAGNTTAVLNETISQDVGQFEFIENLWSNEIGSSDFIPSEYENGVVDPLINVDAGVPGSINSSLFVRIGNTGYGSEITLDSNEHVENISAGWRLNFTLSETFEYLNLSFWWRYDAVDYAFDDWRNTSLEYLDPSPDYQEIRCRIENINDQEKSFWLGNSDTPNRTVFYRVGPNVSSDEIWTFSSFLFYLNQSEFSDFSLELGTFMNTREDRYEYFDAWFDNIKIEGINNDTDDLPPFSSDYGLDRTANNKTKFNFWTNITVGVWESPIANVTVFYNITRSSINSSWNASLFASPDYYVDNAGFNYTSWNVSKAFEFDDQLAFTYVIYDQSGNYYQTPIHHVTIEDKVPPEIIDTLFVQSGDGKFLIQVNVTDWGEGVDQVGINYTKNGDEDLTDILQKTSDYNDTKYGLISLFEINLTVSFGENISFVLFMNDSVNNLSFKSGFSIFADHDIIYPSITEFKVYSDTVVEEGTHVEIRASDDYGEVDRVILNVQYGNGTEQNFTMKYSNTTGYYVPRRTGGLLPLPFDNYETNYTLTAIVYDRVGLSAALSTWHIVEDVVSPQVPTGNLILDYLYPGSLSIKLFAKDDGSGIKNVTLEKRLGNTWQRPSLLSQDGESFFTILVNTNPLGNQQITFRFNATDNVGNVRSIIVDYTTPIFVNTTWGLFLTELLVVIGISSIYSGIKLVQRRRVRTVRRRRFDVAVRRSERLAYLGEEAMFGFMAAYGQGEGITSPLIWEPQFIGHFYQYLKELSDRANNAVDFVMQTKAQDIVTYVDFSIEQIGCTAITFASPVANLPQKWLSSLSLDQTPISTHQGVLMMMLLMREKWSEVSHSFQEEINEGMQEIKDYILAGEDKDIIIQKIQEFRLFISGTIEIMEEIETDEEDITDSIMGDFDSDFQDNSGSNSST